MYHVHQNLHLLCTHMPRTLTISQHHKWHHSLPQHNGNEAINHIKAFLSKQQTYSCALGSTYICICSDTCTAPVDSSIPRTTENTTECSQLLQSQVLQWCPQNTRVDTEGDSATRGQPLPILQSLVCQIGLHYKRDQNCSFFGN
jgi:hypothetical protein